MKKAINLLLIILTATICAKAQVVADSVYTYKISRTILNESQENGAALMGLGVDKASTVALNYGQQSGHFRTVQTAESERRLSLTSNGITTLGRFKISGYFNFHRSWQDSLAWNLQGMQNAATPYYFAAQKAGDFERLNYNFGGLLAFELVPQRIYLAAKADYLYNTASRSVDPRPSVQTFKLNVRPELIFKFNEHLLSTTVDLGYGNENNGIGYKNLSYAQQSQTYADRINYLIMGYGLTTPYGAASLKRVLNDKGIGLNYAYHKDRSYFSGNFSYTEQTEDNTRSLDASARNNRFGVFELKTYKLDLMAAFNGRGFTHQLSAFLNSQNGYDKNYFEVGGLTNYRYQHEQAVLNYTVQTAGQKPTQMEYGVGASFDRTYKRDIGSSINATFAYLQPNLNVTLYHRFNNKERLTAGLVPQIRFPITNWANVPVTTNVFANNIIYPDLRYWSLRSAIVKVNALYVTRKMLENVGVGLGADACYQRELKTGTASQTSGFTPSGSRLDVNLNLNIYF